MTQPNPILASNLPGIAFGDYVDPNPGPSSPIVKTSGIWGTWLAGVVYAPGSQVTNPHDSGQYVALLATVGVRPDTDPASWQLVTLSGGSGSSIGTLADAVLADAPTTLPADGGGHGVPLIMAAPPSWLDGAGNIIEPGLYFGGWVAQGGSVAPTTTGLWVVTRGLNSFPASTPFDQNKATTFSDILCIGSGDVPFGAQMGVVMPTDVTGTLELLPFLTRLAH